MSGGTPVLVIDQPVSTSHADTPGVMRFSDLLYKYNLSAAALPNPRGTYRITIMVPATGQQVTASFRLRT
jgi:hypothetical protein